MCLRRWFAVWIQGQQVLVFRRSRAQRGSRMRVGVGVDLRQCRSGFFWRLGTSLERYRWMYCWHLWSTTATSIQSVSAPLRGWRDRGGRVISSCSLWGHAGRCCDGARGIGHYYCSDIHGKGSREGNRRLCIDSWEQPLVLDTSIGLCKTDARGGEAKHSGSFTVRFSLEGILNFGRGCSLCRAFGDFKLAAGIQQCHALHDFLYQLSLVL